ncbi:MAG: M56 family metallopeptidase [Candidatus Sumerlaeia bacterium]
MNANIETLSRAWAGWAAAASWQIALLVVLVAIAAFLSRRMSARFRYLLWMLVIVKALTPPSMGAFWSIGNWAEPRWGEVSVTIATTPPPLPEPPPAVEPALPTVAMNQSNIAIEPAPVAASAPISTPVQAAQSAPPAKTPWSTAGLLLVAWFAGFATLISFIVIRYWRLTTLLAGAQEADEGPMRVMVEALALRLGRTNPPDLLLSEHFTSPFLFGLLKPRIVLPASLPGELNNAQLEDVLLHELIHWRRRDLLSGWLQIIVQALFWFHPLVWLAGAQLRHERECACDEAALESGCSQARRYGESLLKVLLAARGRSAVAMGFLGIFERNTRLQRRLEEIMNQETRVRRLGWWGWVSLAVFAILCLPMAALSQNGSDRGAGFTPLHMAAQNGHLDTVKLLIGKGADVSARSETGLTPLHLAAQGGHGETAEAIIAAGADVNAKDNSGNTPLTLASEKGHQQLAGMLIAKGADVNPKWVPRPTPKERSEQEAPGAMRYVRVVLGENGELTFEGQPTTLESLPALLEKVPDRPNTVLTFAVDSDKLLPEAKEGIQSISAFKESMPEKARPVYETLQHLKSQYQFKYLSFIGVHPLGSYGIDESKFEQYLRSTASVDIEKSPDNDQPTVQYAAMAICQQAGIPYQWDKSAKMADPERRQFIEPLKIKDVTVEKALIDLLNPVGLRFNLDDNGLYIYKPGAGSDAEQDKIKAQKACISNYAIALERFKIDMGRCPTTAEGLKALTERPAGIPEKDWRGPYIVQHMTDPWGNPMRYVSPGSSGAYDLISAGPDGKFGTDDDITGNDASLQESSGGQSQKIAQPSDPKGHFESGAFVAMPTLDGRLRISPRRQWSDTNIDVQAGDEIEISADGKISGNRPGEGSQYGPDGMTMHGERCFTLIGRVTGAKSSEFIVGSKYRFTAEENGRLYLGVSDSDHTDNWGEFLATVKINGRPVSLARLGYRELAEPTGNLLGAMTTVNGAEIKKQNGEVIITADKKADCPRIRTRELFKPPFMVHFKAKTDTTNIRVYWGGFGWGQFIFNWEVRPNELRLHDPARMNESGIEGQGLVTADEWHDIVWEVQPDAMRMTVDGKQRYECKGNYGDQIAPIGIGPALGSVVTVGTVEIAPLGLKPEPSFEADIKFDEEIPIELQTGTPDQPRMLWCKNIRFSETTDDKKQATINAKLKVGYLSGPKTKWQIQVGLLDSYGKVIASNGLDLENSGMILGRPVAQEKTFETVFNLGPLKAAKFRVYVYQIRDEIETAQFASPQSSIGDLTLSHVPDSSDEKRSLGASGHGVIFQRPPRGRYLEAIRIYAARYGDPEPPAMDFHAYVLNEKYQVVSDLRFPYSTVERGEMKWVTLKTPSIEVPDHFVIALAFNPDQRKGVYLGLAPGSRDNPHSVVGIPSSGFEPMDKPGEWMVCATLSENPSGEKGIQRLADWKPPVEVDPFKGFASAHYEEEISDAKQSYGGRGPAINFNLGEFDLLTPAAKGAYDNLFLKGFRLYAGRYGSGFDPDATMLKVVILDTEKNVLWRGEFPYSRFSYKSGWVDLVLPQPVPASKLTARDRVMSVVFDPEAHQTKGIYFHYTKAPKSSHSFVTKLGGDCKRLEDREWIIRAYFQNGPDAPTSAPAVSSSGNDAEWVNKLTHNQRLFMQWTDQQFDRFLDRRDFSKWQPADRDELLKKCLNTVGGPQTREYYEAINTLGAIGDKSAVPALLKIATDRVGPDCRDNWMAARALGMIGDTSAVPDLIHLSYHTNTNVHFWAQISLVRLTGRNFGYDWQNWGKWWNEQGGRPPFNPEKIRWWDDPKFEEASTAEALAKADDEFFRKR